MAFVLFWDGIVGVQEHPLRVHANCFSLYQCKEPWVTDKVHHALGGHQKSSTASPQPLPHSGRVGAGHFCLLARPCHRQQHAVPSNSGDTYPLRQRLTASAMYIPEGEDRTGLHEGEKRRFVRFLRSVRQGFHLESVKDASQAANYLLSNDVVVALKPSVDQSFSLINPCNPVSKSCCIWFMVVCFVTSRRWFTRRAEERREHCTKLWWNFLDELNQLQTMESASDACQDLLAVQRILASTDCLSRSGALMTTTGRHSKALISPSFCEAVRSSLSCVHQSSDSKLWSVLDWHSDSAKPHNKLGAVSIYSDLLPGRKSSHKLKVPVRKAERISWSFAKNSLRRKEAMQAMARAVSRRYSRAPVALRSASAGGRRRYCDEPWHTDVLDELLEEAREMERSARLALRRNYFVVVISTFVIAEVSNYFRPTNYSMVAEAPPRHATDLATQCKRTLVEARKE
ncbi:hypothetical protein ACP70R_037873 [Stipagrostis hirtigluma subsp. patula]